MAKAKRSRKQKVTKKRSPVVRRAPAAPKGYKKRTNPKIDSKPKSGRGARGGPSAALLRVKRQAAEIKRLRHELREAKAARKRSARIEKKIERLGGFKGVKRILEKQQAKEHRHQVRKHRKEIISKVREIMSYDEGPYEDYEDYERDELLEELREDYDLDLEDWLDICVEDGLTEHEAYELWYGYS